MRFVRAREGAGGAVPVLGPAAAEKDERGRGEGAGEEAQSVVVRGESRRGEAEVVSVDGTPFSIRRLVRSRVPSYARYGDGDAKERKKSRVKTREIQAFTTYLLFPPNVDIEHTTKYLVL